MSNEDILVKLSKLQDEKEIEEVLQDYAKELIRLELACLNRNISDLLRARTLKLMKQEIHCDTCSHPEFLAVLEFSPFSATCETGEGTTVLGAIEDLMRNRYENLCNNG